jgi:hypothetical protein
VSRRRALALGALGALASAAGDGHDPIARAAPMRPTTRSPTDDACVGCHSDVAKEWSASLHRSAFTDPSFVRGYAIEPDAFCRDCHAPATKTTPDVRWAEEQGVTCTSCHGHPEPGETHPASPRLHATKACAGCHEFAFEGAPLPPERATLMQLTMTEHRESAYAGLDCASCHMKTGGHRFDVTRNAPLLSGALGTTVSRREGLVEVTLTPRDVGHAFPTGDMFRRLVVRAEVLGSVGERPIWTREKTFGRAFTIAGTKRTVTDTRLTGPTTARFVVGGLAPGHRLRIRVLYQRWLTTRPVLGAVVEGSPGRLEDEVLLHDILLYP